MDGQGGKAKSDDASAGTPGLAQPISRTFLFSELKKSTAECWLKKKDVFINSL